MSALEVQIEEGALIDLPPGGRMTGRPKRPRDPEDIILETFHRNLPATRPARPARLHAGDAPPAAEAQPAPRRATHIPEARRGT